MQTNGHDLPVKKKWEKSYEIKVVTLLALGFGIVGLDRFIINPLFPVIAKDLGLNYQDLGLISAILALCWGAASIFTGRLSDRIGQRKIIIPAVIIFSILVAGSGLASGLISLIVIRGLMGFAEGAYVPGSIVATIDASKPSRTGLNIGLQQMAAPLFGLGFGPLIAVALLKVLPSWHWVFGAVAIPGLILAYLLVRVLRNDAPPLPDPRILSATPIKSSWREIFQYKNIIFNTLGMFCWLSCLIVLSVFMPNYLVDYHKLSLDQMGIVLAGLGAGSCVGMVALPAMSDKLGRKPVILLALALEIMGLLILMNTGAEPAKLFALLFGITFMNAGVVAITVGPLTSESVPRHLAATATGIVVGLGEIVGGAIAPAVAGVVAQNLGLPYVLHIALGAIGLGFLIALFGIREPKSLPKLTPAEA